MGGHRVCFGCENRQDLLTSRLFVAALYPLPPEHMGWYSCMNIRAWDDIYVWNHGMGWYSCMESGHEMIFMCEIRVEITSKHTWSDEEYFLCGWLSSFLSASSWTWDVNSLIKSEYENTHTHMIWWRLFFLWLAFVPPSCFLLDTWKHNVQIKSGWRSRDNAYTHVIRWGNFSFWLVFILPSCFLLDTWNHNVPMKSSWQLHENTHTWSDEEFSRCDWLSSSLSASSWTHGWYSRMESRWKPNESTHVIWWGIFSLWLAFALPSCFLLKRQNAA